MPSASSPEHIRQLQQALNRALELQLPVDGLMSFRTRRAIRDFQRRKGLPADGIVGRNTEKALIAARSEQASQSRRPSLSSGKESEIGYETGVLNFDSQLEGEASTNCRKDWCDPNYVRWAQRSLNRILGLQLKEDGNLERKTRGALRSFQTKYGLKADSSLGTATEKALIAAGAAAPPAIRQMPCGATSTVELVSLLNKYRGDIPLDFLLGWIRVESGGRIDSLTNLCERGYFQVHPEEAADYGIKNHQDISFNRDYSIQAGLEIVKRCLARARALADKYGLPKQGKLFLGLVKMHHWIPSGPDKILGDMRARGVKPASWDDLKAYVANEENRKRLIKILKGFDPLQGVNNADKTLNNAGPFNNAGTTSNTAPASPPPVGASGLVNRHTVEYAKWVQKSLNKILGLQLVVDGDIGTKTRSAIRSFQQKKGLKDDGKVGAQTEAALIAATRTNPPAGGTTTTTTGAGRKSAAINTPLPREGQGFYSHSQTARQFGLPETIEALKTIGARWHALHPQGPRIGVGEISLQGGGDISGHVSHEKGVDVDLWLMRNDNAEKPTRYQNPEYSRALTRELVNLIHNNGVLKVRFILFNDPQVKNVKEWAGHDNHLHVRFCAPGDSACKPAVQSEFEFGTDEREMMNEYDFKSRDYIQWVQRSLNKILGLRLPVDGDAGNQTRSAIRSFQKRAGLTADGKVGAQTERALIAAGASQPTGSGTTSGSNAPPFPAPAAPLQRETEPPRETLYANIRLGGEAPARAMTGVFIPEGYKPPSQVDLIIYLHGFKINPPPVTMSIDGYWNTRKVPYFPLREALNKSGKNVILVAPTLGPRSQTGWLTGAGGFDRYIAQVLAALAASDTFKGITPSVRHIILACHSGGGLPMRTLALSGQRYAQNIKECWGFDCTYNGGDDTLWARWAKSRADAKLFIYYIAGSRTQIEALKLRAKNVPNVSVIASRTGSHNRVPITHWEERLRGADFLANRSQPTNREISFRDDPVFRSNGGTGGKPVPYIRRKLGTAGRSELEYDDELVEGVGLGLAAFSAGRDFLSSGDLSVQADTNASYVHSNTPVNLLFSTRSIEFKITAHHPRIGIDTQEFFFRLSFDFNNYDLRNVSISVLRDKSSSLFSSDFDISFKASSHSLPNESVARIAYNINGRWDPVGLGDVSFEATPFLVISADGGVQPKQIDSERNWVQFQGWVPGTDRVVRPRTPMSDGSGTQPSGGGTPILRQGSRNSAAVTNLQIRLNRWLAAQGRAPLEVDGDFGAKTKRAVIAFQQAERLKPDGVVGTDTWARLVRNW
jgi:peptidoglycan hydrolase-like protein with peptidoglycan-binding domain